MYDCCVAIASNLAYNSIHNFSSSHRSFWWNLWWIMSRNVSWNTDHADNNICKVFIEDSNDNINEDINDTNNYDNNGNNINKWFGSFILFYFI